MLTGDLVRATLRSGKVRPRYLRVDDEELQAETQVLIELFSRHIGAPVGRLEDAIADHIGDGTDFAVRRGLVKLLMDRATVEMVAPHSPPEVRRLVFEAAAARWPVDGVFGCGDGGALPHETDSCCRARAAISSPMASDAVAAGEGALIACTAPGPSAQTKS